MIRNKKYTMTISALLNDGVAVRHGRAVDSSPPRAARQFDIAWSAGNQVESRHGHVCSLEKNSSAA